MEKVTFLLAFGGGFLSFISPCCLPLYPTFISYITGISVSDLKENNSKKINSLIIIHAISFLIGFSLVFFILGFSASAFGSIFTSYKDLIRMLGGIFIGTMGLFMVGVFKPKFLLKEHRISFKRKDVSILNSILVGIIFSAGWTPCIGPIFSSIMYTNFLNHNSTETLINVLGYSMGFSLPFLLMAFFIGKAKFLYKYSNVLTKIGGFLMIIIGILLYTDNLISINIWFSYLTN